MPGRRRGGGISSGCVRPVCKAPPPGRIRGTKERGTSTGARGYVVPSRRLPNETVSEWRAASQDGLPGYRERTAATAAREARGVR